MKGEQKIYEIFDKLLKRENITAYRVLKDTGIAQATLIDWKKGKSTPKFDKLKRIADYFGVSVEYLMGETDEKISSSPLTMTSLQIRKKHY